MSWRQWFTENETQGFLVVVERDSSFKNPSQQWHWYGVEGKHACLCHEIMVCDGLWTDSIKLYHCSC